MGLIGIDEHSVHVENCRELKRHIRCFALGLGENAEIWRLQGEESRGGISQTDDVWVSTQYGSQYQYSVFV